jgi:ketosteroid isomerase-like protein
MPAERAALEEFVLRFTDAFNRDDLDGVMALTAPHAVYDEFNGRRNDGWAAIREAFVPQFRGDYGTIRFDAEDLFVAPAPEDRAISSAAATRSGPSGKALIRWRCRLERGALRKEWRGLDILHVEDGLVTEKHTYAKAEVPLLRDPK